jgi:HEAT repeat protein
VASGAVDALGAMGIEAEPAVKALVEKFESIEAREAKKKTSDGDYYQEKILTALGHIDRAAAAAVPKLILWLPDRPHAAEVLGRIGPAAKDAIPALDKMHKEGTTYEKSLCAFGLAKITAKPEPYVSEMAGLLQHSKSDLVRSKIVEMLMDFGTDARPALPALLAIVKQKDRRDGPLGGRDLREAAAAALAAFGPDAKSAVPDLIDMVQASYSRAQITAAETLGAIGPDAKAAIPALEKMAQEDERFVSIVEIALARIRAKH